MLCKPLLDIFGMETKDTPEKLTGKKRIEKHALTEESSVEFPDSLIKGSFNCFRRSPSETLNYS